jgi:hypothetical protein
MKSDLMLLEEFGEPLKPSDEHPPAELRHRVMNAIRHDHPRRHRLLPRIARPTGMRLAWRIGAPAAVAATIAAGLIAGNVANVAGNAPAPPTAGSGTAAGTGTPAPPDAAQVLRLAAQHAEDTRPLAARDDQFLYVESMEVRTELHGKDFEEVRTIGPVRVRTWLSVDGTRDGLVTDELDGNTRLSGCRDGLQAETIDRPDTTRKVPCTPQPAYRHTSVPSDPDQLLAYLYNRNNDRTDPVGSRRECRLVPGVPAGGGCIKGSEDQQAFMTLTDLLYQNHSPAVQAAAFRAAARIPGVELRAGVVDAAGRAGVAVTRTHLGTRQELVFDPRTYAFLGHNSIVAEFDSAAVQLEGGGTLDPALIERYHQRRGNPGDVILRWAVLGIDVVDRAGQRP